MEDSDGFQSWRSVHQGGDWENKIIRGEGYGCEEDKEVDGIRVRRRCNRWL